jgi:hypothetical protein
LENLIDLRYECHWKIEFFRGSLEQLNTGINRGLNSDAFRQDFVATDNGRMWLNYNYLNSSSAYGYNANSNRFGIGYEYDIKDNFALGIQYNRVVTNMDGVDSSTHQNKNHVGIYSILNRNDWILKSDLNVADNGIRSNRNVGNLFFNASKTNGIDWWISNRLYMPNFHGLRPYVGAVFGQDQRDAFLETGSVQSYRNVSGVTKDTNYAEGGLHYDKKFDEIGLSSDVGVSSDNYRNYKTSLSYEVTSQGQLALSYSRQDHNSLSTDIIGFTGKLKF